MWLLILMGSITLISILILSAYKRQVNSICRQLEFVEKNDTNKLITTQYNYREIKALADELNRILKKQKQMEYHYRLKDNQLKETITNISHDIRTPLTALNGYFQMLMESTGEEEKKKYSEVIETRIESLKEILEQLFTYVKLQNDSYHFDLEKCNINQILYEAIFSFYNDFKDRNIEPSISIPEDITYIIANYSGLKRAIQNIIKNALDYGREQVIIEMVDSDNIVGIIIKNKYYGMKPVDVDKVFDRFYKVDESRNQNSTGLGLSIAHELIKKMQGNIIAAIEGGYFIIRIEFYKQR